MIRFDVVLCSGAGKDTRQQRDSPQGHPGCLPWQPGNTRLIEKLKAVERRYGTGQRSCTESFAKSELPALFLHLQSYSPSSDSIRREKVKKGSKPWSQDTDMSLSSQHGYHNIHSDLPLFVHDCFVKLTVTQEGSQLVTQCYLKQIKLLIYILGRLWFN